MPWWEDAMVNFMISGGYNVASHIKLINHKTLVVCSENDQIVSNQLSVIGPGFEILVLTVMKQNTEIVV
ncbi:hypothetical protein YC2023_053913 [Brassica napus]